MTSSGPGAGPGRPGVPPAQRAPLVLAQAQRQVVPVQAGQVDDLSVSPPDVVQIRLVHVRQVFQLGQKVLGGLCRRLCN